MLPASSTKESGISKEVPTNITGGVDKKTEELNKSSKLKNKLKILKAL
jgi:hypothetical protein